MISYALSPRWILWHLLWVVVVIACLRLAWWQWDVAGRPHPAGASVQSWRNYAYALNWVIFAGVGAWFWWRFMRDQRAGELRAQAAAADPSRADAGVGFGDGADAAADADAAGSTAAAPRSVQARIDEVSATPLNTRFDPFADDPPQPGGGDAGAGR